MNLILSPEMKVAKFKKNVQQLLERDNAIAKRLVIVREEAEAIQKEKQQLDKDFVEFGLEVLGKDVNDQKATMNIFEVMRELLK